MPADRTFIVARITGKATDPWSTKANTKKADSTVVDLTAPTADNEAQPASSPPTKHDTVGASRQGAVYLSAVASAKTIKGGGESSVTGGSQASASHPGDPTYTSQEGARVLMALSAHGDCPGGGTKGPQSVPSAAKLPFRE